MCEAQGDYWRVERQLLTRPPPTTTSGTDGTSGATICPTTTSGTTNGANDVAQTEEREKGLIVAITQFASSLFHRHYSGQIKEMKNANKMH